MTHLTVYCRNLWAVDVAGHINSEWSVPAEMLVKSSDLNIFAISYFRMIDSSNADMFFNELMGSIKAKTFRSLWPVYL